MRGGTTLSPIPFRIPLNFLRLTADYTTELVVVGKLLGVGYERARAGSHSWFMCNIFSVL